MSFKPSTIISADVRTEERRKRTFREYVAARDKLLIEKKKKGATISSKNASFKIP